MKWFIRILISLTCLIILLLAGVAVLYSQFDPNQYKPMIEKSVSEATNRPFKINGNLDLSFYD